MPRALMPGITGQDPLIFRPPLGSMPKVGFHQIIETMVDADPETETTLHRRTR